MSFDPEQYGSIYEVLDHTSRQFPSSFALHQFNEDDTIQVLSYAELIQRVEKQAKDLKQFGVKPGDRIAILEENSIEHIVTMFAILECQATLVELDPKLEARDCEKLIALSDPQLIILNKNLLHKIPGSIKKRLNLLDIHRNLEPFEKIKTYLSPIDGDLRLAFIVFTSGTSGNFQAVMLEHKAFLHSIKIGAHPYQVKKSDSFIFILPLTHIYGLWILLTALFNGARVNLVKKIQGDAILKIIKKSQATLLPAVPRVIELLHGRIIQKFEGKFFLKKLLTLCGKVRVTTGLNIGKIVFFPIHKAFGRCSLFISGGAALDKNTHYNLQSLGFTTIVGYGLTETTAPVLGTTFDCPDIGVSGKPYPGISIKIDPIPGNEDGEICIQSPALMRGYFRNPEATARVFKNGWFHTGDLGFIDKRGNLNVTGRIKEIIVTSSGEKAMPQDVEERYKDIPFIQELSVVGVPVGDGPTEEIHAAIIVTDELSKKGLTPVEIKERVKSEISKQSMHVPSHLRIQNVHIVTALPKTTTLKVKRNELRTILKYQGELAPKHVEPPKNYDKQTQKLLKIIGLICERSGKPVKNITPSMSFELDLHFDSLTSLECVCEIEKNFNVSIKQPETIKTIAELDLMIRNLRNAGQVENKEIRFQQELLMKGDEQTEFLEVHNPSILQPLFFKTMKFVYRNYFDLEVQGKENIPLEPFIICSNHASHLDAPALMIASGLPIENFGVLAAQDYFFQGSSVRRFFTKLLNLVPFSRSSSKEEVIRNFQLARLYLENKKNIILFPEGTRALNGSLHDFKSFAGILCYELAVPIVPAYIEGAFECLPKGVSFPKKGKIRVTFGKPISRGFFENKQVAGFNLYNEVAQTIHNEVNSLRELSNG